MLTIRSLIDSSFLSISSRSSIFVELRFGVWVWGIFPTDRQVLVFRTQLRVFRGLGLLDLVGLIWVVLGEWARGLGFS